MTFSKISNNKIGLILGNGELPILVTKKARSLGIDTYCICFDKRNLLQISNNAKKAIHLGPGEVLKMGAFLQENKLKQVIFIGKVSKELYFRNPKLDKRAIEALAKRKKLNDDAIMLAAIEELASIDIEVLEQTIFIKDFFAKKGHIAGPKPTDEIITDVNYGFEIAKEIGRMDIGQTVVVQEKMILAIEAIEGTDQAIKRGCKLGKNNATVVKVSKPSQDQRFDIPVVGSKTLKNMKKYGAKTLAIEANETLIVNEKEFKKTAEKLGVTVIAI